MVDLTKYFLGESKFFIFPHCECVWKFHDFSVTHILREINCGVSRGAKSAILKHLEALNLDFFLSILQSLKA